MGFRMGSQVITLDNYRDIFKVCTPDVLDEIRSAIIDDTPIGPFIQLCGDDDYKLGQFRKAIREMVPAEYLNSIFSGTVIKQIRLGLSRGNDMISLLKYANDKGLSISMQALETIAEFMASGVNLDEVDFRKVPDKQVLFYCKGILNNYPMWLLITEEMEYSDKYLSLLMRGMQLGIDIHPFLEDKWDEEILLLLYSFVNKVDLNEFLSKITNKFSKFTVKVLLKLYADGHDIDALCFRDSDGNPLHNEYQVSAISEAIKAGVAIPAMYNINLTDYAIIELMNLETKKRDRLLKVSLKK